MGIWLYVVNKRNHSSFLGINLCTTAVVYIIKHNVVVWYFMIIACIIEIIVTKLEYDYLSKKNLHEKIINGEQW